MSGVHKQCYKSKKIGDMQNMRQRRQEVTIQLRKNKREEALLKKRNLATSKDLLETFGDGHVPESSVSNIIKNILRDIDSDIEEIAIQALQQTRALLSRAARPPIDAVISAGIVPKLVHYLLYDVNPIMQFEAAWALTNIASGTTSQTSTVISAGGVPALLHLLKSHHLPTVEQALWALGNVAGDSSMHRDMVIQLGGVPALINLVQREMPLSFLKILVWTMSNLCRNKSPRPNFAIVSQLLPSFHQILLNCRDAEVEADICWGVSYLTDGNNEQIQTAVDEGIIDVVVQLLRSKAVKVLIPAIRCVGNVVTGTDRQTDMVIQSGALPLLLPLMRHNLPTIVKETTWTISNILAGPASQIQDVVNTGMLTALLAVLQNGDFKSKKEAIYAVTNMIYGGTSPQINVLLHMDFIPALCEHLAYEDSRIVQSILIALYSVCTHSQILGCLEETRAAIEQCGGLDKIEHLQTDANEEVYRNAYKIIDAFFSADNEDEIEFTEISEEPTLPASGFKF